MSTSMCHSIPLVQGFWIKHRVSWCQEVNWKKIYTFLKSWFFKKTYNYSNKLRTTGNISLKMMRRSWKLDHIKNQSFFTNFIIFSIQWNSRFAVSKALTIQLEWMTGGWQVATTSVLTARWGPSQKIEFCN